MKTGPGPGLWPGWLTTALCPQIGLLPRDTRYVELYVVTDSAEVVRRSAGAGLGLAGGPRPLRACRPAVPTAREQSSGAQPGDGGGEPRGQGG